VTRLLAEIRELGYTGSANLLVRYLNQGRAHAERASPLILDQFLSWLMLLGRATYVLQAGRDPGGRRKTNPVAESAKDLRRWSRRPSGSGWPTGRLGW
jgi:hypothetical protein